MLRYTESDLVVNEASVIKLFIKVNISVISFKLSKMKTTDEIENIKKANLSMFYRTVKLKSLPENYDITTTKSRFGIL
jgi:hypothetical protein